MIYNSSIIVNGYYGKKKHLHTCCNERMALQNIVELFKLNFLYGDFMLFYNFFFGFLTCICVVCRFSLRVY